MKKRKYLITAQMKLKKVNIFDVIIACIIRNIQ